MRQRIFSLLGLALLVIFTTILRFASNGTEEPPESRVAGAKTIAFRSEIPEIALPPIRIHDDLPSIRAKAYIVIDVDSAHPLLSQNEQERLPIASVTKLMTAVVSLQEFDLDDVVAVDEKSTSVIGSEIGLKNGEHITVESLLKGLLIQSGNDAAYALAEHKGFDAFVETMNTSARLLGLADTSFKDPAGLDDEAYSTAKDLGVLAAYALRSPTIRRIVAIQEETIASTDGKQQHALENSNRLIKQDHPLYLGEATGLKTGFTPAAGHCLVASAERDGHRLVSVILRTDEQTPEASAKESRKLLDWALSHHEWKAQTQN